jgi:lipoprotein-releasing system permease protein
VKSRFELFIAGRYLRARRKEAVISVITAISVLGVAAGVMALVIALAVNNGFKNTLERNLLGAMAHINVMEKEPLYGIEDWREMAARLRKVPHVTDVAPALYTPAFLMGGLQPKLVVLKGVDVDAEAGMTESLRHLKNGSLDPLRDSNADPAGIVLGSGIVEDTAMKLHSRITGYFQGAELTPMGPRASMRYFRVAGVFESGFFEIDDNWAYAPIGAVQRALGVADVVNQMELKLDDLNLATDVAAQVEKVVGPKYTTTTWMERNRQLLDALKMERRVTVITIGLIELVAALNIFITLVMMVMEKYRDIAVLMSMGARQSQVRNIFILQGILIGVAGSALGLLAGYSLCYFANTYRWVPLDQTVYSLSFVPFEPRPYDGIWIAAAAILVSFLATIYPARGATRIAPAEVLRYE